MENNLINNNNVIILSKYIDVRLNSKNKEWYTNKGYTWTKSGDTIRVKVKDLSPKSENIIKVICPKCQREHYTLWKSVYNTHDTLCHECNKQRPNILKCQFCGELTNRKYNNLGICNRHRYQINKYGETIQENSMNTRNRKNKYYSNIKGITYNKKSNVWESYITYKNINISLLQNKDINKVVFSRYYTEKLLFKDFSSIEYESIKDYIDNCLDKEKIKNKVKQRIKEKLNI